MGINVGSTLNAHLVAFQLHRYALALVACGYIASALSRSARLQHLGESVFGLGLLFMSIGVMSEGIAPLKGYKPFLALLAHMNNPILAVLVSAVSAVVFQSSNTVIAIAIMLGQQGFLTLDVALTFVLGGNIGTCFTSIIAAVGKRRDAMRVAVAYLLFKVVGVLLLVPFLPNFTSFIEFSTAAAKLRAEEKALADAVAAGTLGEQSHGIEALDLIRETARRAVMPAQIANAHTFLNLFIAIIFMPFLDQVASIMVTALPAHSAEGKRDGEAALGAITSPSVGTDSDGVSSSNGSTGVSASASAAGGAGGGSATRRHMQGAGSGARAGMDGIEGASNGAGATAAASASSRGSVRGAHNTLAGKTMRAPSTDEEAGTVAAGARQGSAASGLRARSAEEEEDEDDSNDDKPLLTRGQGARPKAGAGAWR